MTSEIDFDDAVGSGVLIRYDGNDADLHRMEISELAVSLKGLARIIAVAANFAATQKLVLHQDAMAIRVTVEPPKAHCFEMIAMVKWASENPLFAQAVGGFLSALLTYIFLNAAHKKDEMKHLRGALDAAIKELGTRDQATVDRLLATIDKMAEALRPAAKQAVTPIGQSATTLTIGPVGSASKTVLDQSDRDAITTIEPNEITAEQTFTLEVSELDTDSGGAHVRLISDHDTRISAKITDPAFAVPDNAYALALASKEPLTVKAKAAMAEGRISKLFISDTV